jgi:hypothetical protein
MVTSSGPPGDAPASLTSRSLAKIATVAARARAQGEHSPGRAGIEDRQHRVADELQHLATLRRHRRHDAIEIAIEHANEGLFVQFDGHSGGAAQIAQHDRRVHADDIATPDLSVENALCRKRADVDPQQLLPRALQALDLHDPG